MRYGAALSLLLCVVLLCGNDAWSRTVRDYGLQPRAVADDTYVVFGLPQHFTLGNRCNIVNTAFIVTAAGVVVFDTGPTRLYGEQLRAAIRRVTDLPVIQVYNTHSHPDHFLGNQAFADVPIAALPGTRDAIAQQGETFSESMYRLCGPWAAGTQVVVPNERVQPGIVDIGGHRLRLIALQGHTTADLVVLDETTGVLFAGDLVFNGRTPTTPHASPDDWINALDTLRHIDYSVLVPGHGAIDKGTAALVQTSDYLRWLSQRLRDGAERGDAMAEMLQPGDLPASIGELTVFPAEYQRSVSHLFPRMEQQALVRGRVEQSSP